MKKTHVFNELSVRGKEGKWDLFSAFLLFCFLHRRIYRLIRYNNWLAPNLKWERSSCLFVDSNVFFFIQKCPLHGGRMANKRRQEVSRFGCSIKWSRVLTIINFTYFKFIIDIFFFFSWKYSHIQRWTFRLAFPSGLTLSLFD